MGAEKRAEARTKVRQLVSLRAVAERRSFLAYTVDVSPGGMFIETKDACAPGAKLSLLSPNGAVEMIVVRRASKGLGLRRA